MVTPSLVARQALSISTLLNSNCVCGCSRCLVALNRYEGEFSRYRSTKAEVVGITSCGDCPGYALMGAWP
ncbi:MAG: CGGC domain-containing protein [Thermodesulfobacteriota bacterium]